MNYHVIFKLYDDPEFSNEIATTRVPTVSTTNIDIQDLVIFPNPTTNAFQIKNDADIASISIHNVVGAKMRETNHSQGMIHDVSDLRTGMYLVRLQGADGKIIKSMRLSKR